MPCDRWGAPEAALLNYLLSQDRPSEQRRFGSGSPRAVNEGLPTSQALKVDFYRGLWAFSILALHGPVNVFSAKRAPAATFTRLGPFVIVLLGYTVTIRPRPRLCKYTSFS